MVGLPLIVLRRAFALFFVLVFPLIFLATLLTLRVNATVLEPDFYTGTLDRVDAYNFLYDHALPLTIGASGVDLEQDIPLGLQLTPETLAGYAREILPPAWLAQNTSSVLHQVLPYATGREESFRVEVRLDDRVEAAADVLRNVVQEADIHGFLLDEVVRPELERDPTMLQSLPFGLTLTTEQAASGVAEIVPEQWLKDQSVLVLEEVVPYVTGEADGFTVVIPLQERADVALIVLERWLLESLDNGAYDYLIQEQVMPVVQTALDGAVELPYGIVITDAEIATALAAAMPPSWMAEQIGGVVDAMGPYLTGRSDMMLVSIPIEDRADLAAQALVNVADAKFAALYHSLPACTNQQLHDMELSLTTAPECAPAGVSYQDLKMIVGLDVLDQLVLSIAEPLPPSIPLDEQILVDSMGEDFLDEVRTMLRDGFVFTEADLDQMLMEQGGQDLLAQFHDGRSYLRNGFAFTQEDMRATVGTELAVFDRAREGIGAASSVVFLLLLLPLGMAAAVGFLGGRTWGTRLAWAGVPLVGGGIAVAVVTGAGAGLFRGVTESLILGMDSDQIIIFKIIEVRNELVRAFVTPITVQSSVAAIVGVAAIAGGFWLAKRASSNPTFSPLAVPLSADGNQAAHRSQESGQPSGV
ncbi:MAG: hypothetical protein WD645_05480 [Dehalococcoidia bacterium]